MSSTTNNSEEWFVIKTEFKPGSTKTKGEPFSRDKKTSSKNHMRSAKKERLLPAINVKLIESARITRGKCMRNTWKLRSLKCGEDWGIPTETGSNLKLYISMSNRCSVFNQRMLLELRKKPRLRKKQMSKD